VGVGREEGKKEGKEKEKRKEAKKKKEGGGMGFREVEERGYRGG